MLLAPVSALAADGSDSLALRPVASAYMGN